jgi:putative transposase
MIAWWASGSSCTTGTRSSPVRFDDVFRTEGAWIIHTPIRAPNANAFAERFVQPSARTALDHALIYRRRHLERVLGIYVEHYMEERPYRGLGLAAPQGEPAPVSGGPKPSTVTRRDVLGALSTSTGARRDHDRHL